MCTVIVAHRVVADAPLVIAHNRDERLDRPTRDVAAFVVEGRGVVVGGRDEVSGGSWFACGARVVAAVTNDRRRGPSLPGRVSRGALVAHAATSASVADALAGLVTIAAGDVGPFHLLIADGDRLAHLTNVDGEMAAREVEPGLHVLGNFGLDDDDDPVVRYVHAALGPSPADDAARLEAAMKDVLGHHGPGRPCLHHDVYGTRTSGCARLFGPDEGFASTDGPSCTSSWRDHSRALATVRR